MKGFIEYGETSFECEGNTIQEFIENNFNKLGNIIQSKAGNIAGYILDSAYVAYDEKDEIFKLHVFAHGSDGLVNYNPCNDPTREVVFKIIGIEKGDVPNRYDFQITSNKFDPFTVIETGNTNAIIGTLEATIDYLAESCSNDKPAEKLMDQMNALKRQNTQAYINRLLTLFGLMRYRKTAKTEKYEHLISDLVAALEDVKSLSVTDDGSTIIFYSKAISAHRSANRISALEYYRKRSGKSQKEVAEYAGISLRQYQRYESGEANLWNSMVSVCFAICEAIGVRFDQVCNIRTGAMK